MVLARGSRVLCGCATACLLTGAAQAQVSAAPVKTLRLDQTIESSLHPGKAESFSVPLAAGDYMQAIVDQIDGPIDVTVFDSSGEKVKFVSNNSFTSNRPLVETGELELVDVVSLKSGDYRIEARSVGGKGGRYTITYSEHKSMVERMQLPPVTHRFHSQRIETLRHELQQGNRAAIGAFWEQVKLSGEPLIEPIDSDPNHLLVTLLWRDSVGIKNVALHWESYAYNEPEQYAFEHMPESDVWYLTLRLPAGARFVYQLSPDDDLVPYSRFSPDDNNATVRHEAGEMLDPLNPKRWVQHNGEFSLAELPGAPAQPWTERKEGIPEGTVEKKRFASERLHNDREIAVYTPPGYSSSHGPYSLLVLFDEKQYLTMVPTPAILDNLIEKKKIPPLVAVLVDAIDRDTRRAETMGPLADEYADVMSTDLIAWIRKNYHVASDPEHTIVAGSSANGFAAVYMAWRHPDVFGNVLCQSGALFWEPGTGPGTGIALGDNPEWLARHLAAAPKKPIRFFVEAGLFEDSRESILDTSRHFRDVAIAKGYDIRYQEFAGGHNYINWRGSLADGLIYLTHQENQQSKQEPGDGK